MKKTLFLVIALIASASAWAIERDNASQSHEWVDLGLPSGTLWATMNIGASSPEEYGDYFAWGETEPKDYYDWSTYKWSAYQSYDGINLNKLTKYCTISSSGYDDFVDNKTELDSEDDAATVCWGGEWRMPSLEQMEELYNNCISQWTTRNGIYGRLFTSNINGASLFLPAPGDRLEDLQYQAGIYGNYWSRKLCSDSPYFANYMRFSSDRVMWYGDSRNLGFSIRAVRESTQTGIDEINAAAKNGQRYNLMGQPVGKDYKGIVIEDGKKIIVR